MHINHSQPDSSPMVATHIDNYDNAGLKCAYWHRTEAFNAAKAAAKGAIAYRDISSSRHHFVHKLSRVAALQVPI